MKKSTGSFSNSYQNKRLHRLPSSPKFHWLCPRSGCTVPSHDASSQPVKSRGSLQGYPGLLTAWIGISWSVYCPAFFPESCCQAWPQPLEELNDAQCVNGITQHPFSWLRLLARLKSGLWRRDEQGCLKFPQGWGSRIGDYLWDRSTVLSIGWECGGGCNQPGIIQPGCGGAAGLQILFSMCSFFLFSGHATWLAESLLWDQGLSLGDGQWSAES